MNTKGETGRETNRARFREKIFDIFEDHAAIFDGPSSSYLAPPSFLAYICRELIQILLCSLLYYLTFPPPLYTVNPYRPFHHFGALKVVVTQYRIRRYPDLEAPEL